MTMLISVVLTRDVIFVAVVISPEYIDPNNTNENRVKTLADLESSHQPRISAISLLVSTTKIVWILLLRKSKFIIEEDANTFRFFQHICVRPTPFFFAIDDIFM
jgi:type III secretory pathway component EscU